MVTVPKTVLSLCSKEIISNFIFIVPSLVLLTRSFLTNITMTAVAATRNAPSTDTAAIHGKVNEEDEGFDSHFFITSSTKMKKVAQEIRKEARKHLAVLFLKLHYAY